MTCPICFNDNNTKCFWKCNHQFCDTCINEWQKQDQEGNCPICRECNIRGYGNIIRILNKYIIKKSYTCIKYTYRFIKWALKDLNNFIEESVTSNYDSTIQGIISPRDRIIFGSNTRDMYHMRLRNRRSIH